jgi:hypothetical protein
MNKYCAMRYSTHVPHYFPENRHVLLLSSIAAAVVTAVVLITFNLYKVNCWVTKCPALLSPNYTYYKGMSNRTSLSSHRESAICDVFLVFLGNSLASNDEFVLETEITAINKNTHHFLFPLGSMAFSHFRTQITLTLKIYKHVCYIII